MEESPEDIHPFPHTLDRVASLNVAWDDVTIRSQSILSRLQNMKFSNIDDPKPENPPSSDQTQAHRGSTGNHRHSIRPNRVVNQVPPSPNRVLGHSKSMPRESLSLFRSSSFKSIATMQFREAIDISSFYHVGQELGSGGFAVVKKGTCVETNVEYALKLISNSVYKRHKKMVRSEVQTMSMFNHPRLVKLHEVVQTRDHFVVVAELLSGGELFNHIVKMKKFTETAAKSIFRQIAEGVLAMHEQQVIHRDLKPENILLDLDADGGFTIKITDFGLAVLFDPNNPPHDGAGTAEYSAPEVVSSDTHDFSCDMWSLGVILYVMLSGCPPFHGQTDDEVVRKVKSGTVVYAPRHWDSISPEGCALVRSLLSFSPKARPTVQQVLAHPWLAEEPTPQSSPSPLGQVVGRIAELQQTARSKKLAPLTSLAAVVQDTLANDDDMKAEAEQQQADAPLVAEPQVSEPIAAPAAEPPASTASARDDPPPREEVAGDGAPVTELQAPPEPSIDVPDKPAQEPVKDGVAAALDVEEVSSEVLSSSARSDGHVPEPTEAFNTHMEPSGPLPGSILVDFPPVDVVSVPSITDRFVLTKKLGEGGYAEVRKGTNVQTGDEFAMKMISKQTLKKHSEMVQRETSIMLVMDHPGVVKLHEVLDTPSHLIIVTELVRGGPILDHIAKMKRYSDFIAKIMFRQIVEAVAEMHARGVMHRDLKSDNILVDMDADGEIVVKITDFGLALVYNPCYPPKGVCGSIEYSAPEMVLGQHHDFACDMWSLGVLLYIMLSGHSPFLAATPEATKQNVLNMAYSFPEEHWEGVTPEAIHLVESLLVPAGSRPIAASVLNHPWFASEAFIPMPQVSEALAYQLAVHRFRQAVFVGLATNRLRQMRQAKLEQRGFKADAQGFALKCPQFVEFRRATTREIFTEYSLEDRVAVPSLAELHMAVSSVGAPCMMAVYRTIDVARNLKGIQTEIEALANLSHPRVVGLTEVVRTNDHVVLVLQRPVGLPLFEAVVANKTMTEDNTRDIVIQILEALEALHRRGYVHRHLSPKTVFVSFAAGHPEVQVVSLAGCVQLSNPPANVKEVSRGTCNALPEFSAPEVLRPQVVQGPTCDLWSVGVMMYMMLSGRHPFPAATKTDLLLCLRHNPVMFPPGEWSTVSPEAKSFIRHLLCLEPTARPTLEQAFSNPWITLYRAQDQTPLPELTGRLKRHLAVANLRAVVFVALTVHRFCEVKAGISGKIKPRFIVKPKPKKNPAPPKPKPVMPPTDPVQQQQQQQHLQQIPPAQPQPQSLAYFPQQSFSRNEQELQLRPNVTPPQDDAAMNSKRPRFADSIVLATGDGKVVVKAPEAPPPPPDAPLVKCYTPAEHSETESDAQPSLKQRTKSKIVKPEKKIEEEKPADKSPAPASRGAARPTAATAARTSVRPTRESAPTRTSRAAKPVAKSSQAPTKLPARSAPAPVPAGLNRPRVSVGTASPAKGRPSSVGPSARRAAAAKPSARGSTGTRRVQFN